MRMLSSMVAVVAGGMILTGCDWSSSGNDSSWSSRYDGVDFSGVYRGANGGSIITGVSSEGSENQVNVKGEQIATGTGTTKSFNAGLQNTPVVAGSATIYFGGSSTEAFNDNGNGSLSGSAGGSGTINYSNGRVSITAANAPENGVAIRADYAYTVTIGGGEGWSLSTLNVTQTGQHLTIVASNGAEFSGNMGGLSSSLVDDGVENVVAEFSAASEFGGQKIRLVGTFSSVILSNPDSGSAVLAERRMSATWIEEGTGVSLDVNGVTSNLEITIISEETPPAETTTE